MMSKKQSEYEYMWKRNHDNYNTQPWIHGHFLLEEGCWMDAGIYMTGYEMHMPIIMEDEDIASIVDNSFERMMK